MPGFLHIIERPLPYVPRLATRDDAAIDLVVMHCTELPDLATAREFGERVLYPQSQTGNSGHYYIDRDGRVEQWVPDTRVAHHTRGYNPRSIGIELVNRGRWPHWHHSRHQTMTEPYPAAQIDALIAVLHRLEHTLAVGWIAGHEELDLDYQAASDDAALQVRRKLDPGPQFPWQRVLSEVRMLRFPASA